MTRSAEFNEKYFPYEEIVQDIVLHDEELEGDIRRLQSMVVATDNYYREIYERHCDIPGWFLIHQQLGWAVGNPEELLKILPEE